MSDISFKENFDKYFTCFAKVFLDNYFVIEIPEQPTDSSINFVIIVN